MGASEPIWSKILKSFQTVLLSGTNEKADNERIRTEGRLRNE